MARIPGIRRLFQLPPSTKKVAGEIDDEIAFHLEERTQELIAEGMEAEEARAEALREFGDVEQAKAELEEIGRRRVRRLVRSNWWSDLRKDVRYAFRQIRRSPGFAAVIIAMLALGTGGTTAVFSVVQAVLLAPLPYERPGQLVRLYLQEPGNTSYGIYLPAPQFKEIRDHVASFQDVAALMTYNETGADLVKDGRAERLRLLEVSSGYFRTLGSTLQRGREFDREDEVGTDRVVLSDELWRSRFSSDPSIVGTTIHLSDQRVEVVGIAPPGFEDPIIGDVDAWVPYDLASEKRNRRTECRVQRRGALTQ